MRAFCGKDKCSKFDRSLSLQLPQLHKILPSSKVLQKVNIVKHFTEKYDNWLIRQEKSQSLAVQKKWSRSTKKWIKNKVYLCVHAPLEYKSLKSFRKGLASYCKAKTTFTFHSCILTLSNALSSINNREMKSENGFSLAMASLPFWFGSKKILLYDRFLVIVFFFNKIPSKNDKWTKSCAKNPEN